MKIKYAAAMVILLAGGLRFSSVARAAAGDGAPRLNITIVEGEGAINNIKQRTVREAITQIEVDFVWVDLGGGLFLTCDLDDDGIMFDSCAIEDIYADDEDEFEVQVSLAD
jgi:hypothetical protein